MEPLIKESDKLRISRYSSLKINDIVVFKKRGRLIAHRIIYIHPLGKYLITKGDNNNKSDGKIKFSQILGVIKKVSRNKNEISLNHLYLSQSLFYFKELLKICRTFNKYGISYIFLKGLFIHLRYEEETPKRFFSDADILIKKGSEKRVIIILKKLNFSIHQHLLSLLFNKKTPKASQMLFIKKNKPVSIVIDLHTSLPMPFSKNSVLNNIFLPKTQKINALLFKNIEYLDRNGSHIPILNPEIQFLYSLLDFWHHNFNRIHRLNLIDSIAKKESINWELIVRVADNFSLQNLIYPACLMFNKYYPNRIPKSFIRKISPNFTQKAVAKLIVNFISPFNNGSDALERIKRFAFLFLLSPLPLSQKIKNLVSKEVSFYILPSIKLWFFKSFRNLLKSRLV